MVGLAFGNSPSAMPAAGGRTPLFGTNPIAAIFPRRDARPLAIDLSLSEVARGKLMVAAKEGKAIPLGWALDRDGAPTTDPAAGLRRLDAARRRREGRDARARRRAAGDLADRRGARLRGDVVLRRRGQPPAAGPGVPRDRPGRARGSRPSIDERVETLVAAMLRRSWRAAARAAPRRAGRARRAPTASTFRRRWPISSRSSARRRRCFATRACYREVMRNSASQPRRPRCRRARGPRSVPGCRAPARSGARSARCGSGRSGRRCTRTPGFRRRPGRRRPATDPGDTRSGSRSPPRSRRTPRCRSLASPSCWPWTHGVAGPLSHHCRAHDRLGTVTELLLVVAALAGDDLTPGGGSGLRTEALVFEQPFAAPRDPDAAAVVAPAAALDAGAARALLDEPRAGSRRPASRRTDTGSRGSRTGSRTARRTSRARAAAQSRRSKRSRSK